MFGDRALAEDLTQETFASVVIAIRDGRAGSLTMPWLIGVARHKLIDHYRSTSREQRRLALRGQEGSATRMTDSRSWKTSIRPASSHSYERSLRATASS